jgi:hypothetical protein
VMRNIPLASLTSIEPDSKATELSRNSLFDFDIPHSTVSRMIQSYTTPGLTHYIYVVLFQPLSECPRTSCIELHVGFNAITGGFTVGVDSSSHFTDGVFSTG